jgi:hypothetical protein
MEKRPSGCFPPNNLRHGLLGGAKLGFDEQEADGPARLGWAYMDYLFRVG